MAGFDTYPFSLLKNISDKHKNANHKIRLASLFMKKKKGRKEEKKTTYNQN